MTHAATTTGRPWLVIRLMAMQVMAATLDVVWVRLKERRTVYTPHAEKAEKALQISLSAAKQHAHLMASVEVIAST